MAAVACPPRVRPSTDPCFGSLFFAAVPSLISQEEERLVRTEWVAFKEDLPAAPQGSELEFRALYIAVELLSIGAQKLAQECFSLATRLREEGGNAPLTKEDYVWHNFSPYVAHIAQGKRTYNDGIKGKYQHLERITSLFETFGTLPQQKLVAEAIE